jgi:hypothetical protein
LDSLPGKQLQLVREVMPGAARIGTLREQAPLT